MVANDKISKIINHSTVRRSRIIMFRRRHQPSVDSKPRAEVPNPNARELMEWDEKMRDLSTRNNDLIRIAREICSMGGDVYRKEAEKKSGPIQMRRVVVLSDEDPIATLLHLPWGEDLARYASKHIREPRLIATLGYTATPLNRSDGARKEFMTLWPGLTTIYGLGGVPLEDLTRSNPAPIPPSYTGQASASSYYTVTHAGGVSERIMELAQQARNRSTPNRDAVAGRITTHVEGLESWFELIQRDVGDPGLNRHFHHEHRPHYKDYGNVDFTSWGGSNNY